MPIPFVDGKAGFGKAIKLNGEDQFVEITGGQPDDLAFAGGSMSIAGWFKVDVFVQKARPFDQNLLARRMTRTDLDPSGRPVPILSAEDVLLHKLEWFRLGGETSDRQWGDVLGVLRVQAGRLDDGYLDRWAAELGVADLLAKARAAAAPPPAADPA